MKYSGGTGGRERADPRSPLHPLWSRTSRPVVLRPNQLPQLGILHKRVHACKYTKHKPVHPFPKPLPRDEVLPEGKQRPEHQITPVNHCLRLSSLHGRKIRETVEFSEMVPNRPHRVMVQGLGQVTHFPRTDELWMGFSVVHPARASTKDSKLIIGVAPRPPDPLAVEIIPPRHIVGHRAGRIVVL